MALLENKLIVYDGACPLCISLRDKVLRWNIFPQEKLANYYDLAPETAVQVDGERFRQEMALIDLEGNSTLYGPDALKRIFSERFLLARLFFAIPGIMWPIRFIYRTIAFNRYVISTPRKDMPACDCAPAAPARFHAAYLLYCVLIAVAATLLFGAAVGPYLWVSTPVGAMAMLIVAGTGWVVQALLALVAFGERRILYIRHMATVMRKGVMPLVPAAILLLIPLETPLLVAVLAVLISSGYMVRQHALRVWQMGVSQGWTVLWFLVLQSTALLALYLLNNNTISL